MRQPVAGLQVHLGVRIEIDVAIRSLDSTIGALLEVIEENVGVIMGKAHARRKVLLVIGVVEVPVVGGLALQSRVVGPTAESRGRERSLRAGPAIVGPYTGPVEHAGQE